MRHPAIDSLLILQDREQNRRSLTRKLEAIPGETRVVENKISAEKNAIENAKSELQSLESRKKMLETEIGSAEDKLAKYKTQQALVKKNDEYQALGHEIESTEAAISELEGQELEVMFEIDSARERFVVSEKSLRENIAEHEQKLAMLAERKINLAAELKTAEQVYSEAREPVSERFLRVFDRIAKRHLPVCAPIQGGNCSGCHLKVSGENESVARKGEELATCDQCGRIVWFES